MLYTASNKSPELFCIYQIISYRVRFFIQTRHDVFVCKIVASKNDKFHTCPNSRIRNMQYYEIASSYSIYDNRGSRSESFPESWSGNSL